MIPCDLVLVAIFKRPQNRRSFDIIDTAINWCGWAFFSFSVTLVTYHTPSNLAMPTKIFKFFGEPKVSRRQLERNVWWGFEWYARFAPSIRYSNWLPFETTPRTGCVRIFVFCSFRRYLQWILVMALHGICIPMYSILSSSEAVQLGFPTLTIIPNLENNLSLRIPHHRIIQIRTKHNYSWRWVAHSGCNSCHIHIKLTCRQCTLEIINYTNHSATHSTQ